MKICYIAPEGIHTKRWVEYFAERGHEIHLITLMAEDIQSAKIYPIKTKAPKLSPLFKAIRIRNLVKKIKPDILHAHEVVPFGLYGALSGFHPFVVSVWGSDVLRAPKESKISGYIIPVIFKKADIITTTAEFMREYLNNAFKAPKSKIIRIPWGIDLKVFHRGYEEEVKRFKESLGIGVSSPIIISNRHMNPQYEIQSIIDSIPYVTKIYPNVLFVFIRGYGSPDFENEMKVRAKKLGVINNIWFISRHIPPKEMAVLLNASNMFISIPKTDQFGSSIMEGMACGAIPIVSTIKVYEQYLEDGKNAFFVNPESPEKIAEKIIYCIEHPEIEEKFYKINKKIIEKNEDWDRNAKKMEELYENLLKGQS